MASPFCAASRRIFPPHTGPLPSAVAAGGSRWRSPTRRTIGRRWWGNSSVPTSNLPLTATLRRGGIASLATRRTNWQGPSFSRPSRWPCRATGPSPSSGAKPGARQTHVGYRRPAWKRRRRSRGDCLRLLRRRRQRDRQRRRARLHDGVGRRRSAAGWHQLRLMPRRNPQHHRIATRARADVG